MDFILKDFNLNFSKFLNHLLCKTKIVHTLINRLIYALVLNIKAMYPAPVKVRKKDFSFLAGKQQKCRSGAQLNCHSIRIF